MRAMLLLLSCLTCAGLASRKQIARQRTPAAATLVPYRGKHELAKSTGIVVESQEAWLNRRARAQIPKKTLALLLSKITAAARSHVNPDRSLEDRFLRFRGGAQGDDPVEAALKAKTRTGPMSREEILEKLNRVPVFCIAQLNGTIISLPNPDGDEGAAGCTWYLDANEAQLAFRSAIAANPMSGLHLQVHTLGEVFTQCHGWPTDTSSAAATTSDSTFKLQAAKALLQVCDAQLVASLRKQELDPGSWRVPVFIGEALAQAGPKGEQLALPIFFSPEDLQRAYIMAQVPQSEMERGMSVMDIRSIVARMEEEPVDFPNPWRAIQFITTPAAMKLAQELGHQQGTTQ